jgi:hypothetical protein
MLKDSKTETNYTVDINFTYKIEERSVSLF